MTPMLYIYILPVLSVLTASLVKETLTPFKFNIDILVFDNTDRLVTKLDRSLNRYNYLDT